MPLLRRFLVLQALLLWQAGFLFYAAVVVPTGTEVLGAFAQGRVTREVTVALNLIGAVALALLAWDQWAESRHRRGRWGLWIVLAVTLVGLLILHPMIESRVDFAADGRVNDYPGFYLWHRVYLIVSTIQWAAGLGYTALMLRAWTARSATNSGPP
jgi:hypothetical protein